MRTIKKCPICGSDLQATVKAWWILASITIGNDGALEYELDYEYASLTDPGERRFGFEDRILAVYCENDHTEAEMLRALEHPGIHPAARN